MYNVKDKKRTFSRTTFSKTHNTEFKGKDLEDKLKELEGKIKEIETTIKHRDAYINNIKEGNEILNDFEQSEDYTSAKLALKLLNEGKAPKKANYKYGKELVAIFLFLKAGLEKDELLESLNQIKEYEQDFHKTIKELKELL
jgi:hypothetical protein